MSKYGKAENGDDNEMNCNVEGVYMNLRYRILNIGEERYILDMGGSSFWRILFPLLYWIIPVNVYKVDDNELLEKIVTPYIEQKGIGWQLALGSFVPLGLGNLLYPLVEYFNMEITPLTSIIIIAIIFFLLIDFFSIQIYYMEKNHNNTLILRNFLRRNCGFDQNQKSTFFISFIYTFC